jgi:hypothetical protein
MRTVSETSHRGPSFQATVTSHDVIEPKNEEIHPSEGERFETSPVDDSSRQPLSSRATLNEKVATGPRKPRLRQANLVEIKTNLISEVDRFETSPVDESSRQLLSSRATFNEKVATGPRDNKLRQANLVEILFTNTV